jgi:hypothetical protein
MLFWLCGFRFAQEAKTTGERKPHYREQHSPEMQQTVHLKMAI